MEKKPNDQKVECMKLIDTHEMGWVGVWTHTAQNILSWVGISLKQVQSS